ncbi:MAG: B12-binding domain-containing radical SAM protein [Halobacteriota archaeon]
MRVYFLHPPFVSNGKTLPKFHRSTRWQGVVSLGGTYWYPIWLSYATGVIEDAGYQAKLVDASAKEWGIRAVKNDIDAFDPDVLVIESNFSSVKNDIDIIAELKRDSDFLSVLVGPPASQFQEAMLKNDHVDVVGRYEYDLTIRDIAVATEEGADLGDVLGISYRRGGHTVQTPDRPLMTSEQLDAIPYVTSVYKKHLDIRDYTLSHTLYPMVQVFTARGCPNRCTFCSWPRTFMGRKFRARSVANVVDEFEYVSKELPAVKEIFVEDDTFTIDKQRVREVCAELQKRELGVRWSCNARATLDYETMRVMKSAGCRLIDVGYESGSDQILKNIKKGVTTAETKTFTVDAKRAGLKILGDFIFGLPEETDDTIKQTIQFIKEIKPDMLQIAVATPIPGTEFYQWISNNGYLVESDSSKTIDEHGFQRCVISYPNLSSDDLVRSVESALKEYYFSATFARIAIRNILSRDGLWELTGLLKSARAFFKHANRSS